MLKVTFENNQSPFFRSLKEKVDHYFSTKKLDPAGDARLYFKGILQVVSAVALYITLVFFTPSTPIAILLCSFFGLNMAIIGFNIMHEGGHSSFSKHTWLNKVSAYSLNALGGNTY